MIITKPVASRVLSTLVLGGLLIAPSQNWAASYVVDRFDDAPGADTCSIFAANDCSLRGAVLKANQESGQDDLFLMPGTYTLTVAGRNEDLAATGDLDILFDMTLQPLGPGTTVTINGGDIDRILDIRDTAAVTIKRLVLTNGSVPGSPGGAIQIKYNASLRLENSIIDDNIAKWGGGICNFGTLDIVASKIEGNDASDQGGGIYNQRAMTLTDSTVGLFNSAAKGGGLYNSGNPATLVRSTFWANSASEDGGGVFNSNGMSMENCSFFLNSAPSGSGGGIFSEHWLLLHSVTLTGNTSDGTSNGSAIYGLSGDLMITDSIIQGDCVPGPDTVSYGGNLESPGNTCGLTHDDDLVNVADPMLGGVSCIGRDQRNRKRPIDGDGDHNPLCDSGAYEYDPAEIFVDSFESGGAGAWS